MKLSNGELGKILYDRMYHVYGNPYAYNPRSEADFAKELIALDDFIDIIAHLRAECLEKLTAHQEHQKCLGNAFIVTEVEENGEEFVLVEDLYDAEDEDASA
jgi:hypothetical protein